MHLKDWIALFGFVVLSQAVGIIGSFFTVPAVGDWYATLVRPELSPPNWVFGPVWTVLYTLMGVAAFLVWRKRGERREVKMALGIFVLQLFLNALWSVIFFGLRLPGAALVEILFLWFAILATIISFSRISKSAAWLLLPYLLWVSFAAYLNYMIWVLNV